MALDTSPDLTTPDTPEWQQRVEDALRPAGREVAAALGRLRSRIDVDVTLIKEGPGHLACRLTTGSRSLFAKLFDGSAPAGIAYGRERDALCALRNTGLVPQIRAHCDVCRWIVMEDFGPPVPPPSPTTLAGQIGRWVAGMEYAAPCAPASGNWLGYLRQIGYGPYLTEIPDAEDTLRRIPLCGLVLTRNDPALRNFLNHPSGRLAGCDFDRASLRPRGWEFITLWSSLEELYPGDADAVLTAFAEGFARTHRGGLLVDELIVVASLLSCANTRRNGGTDCI